MFDAAKIQNRRPQKLRPLPGTFLVLLDLFHFLNLLSSPEGFPLHEPLDHVERPQRLVVGKNVTGVSDHQLAEVANLPDGENEAHFK